MNHLPYHAPRWHSVSLRGLIWTVLTSSLLVTCKKDDPKPLQLAASFQLTANNCVAPCDPGFKNLSQYAQSYSWNFGDGATSTEETPTHTYAKGGNYTVNLRITGEANQVDDTTVTATILDPAPTAAFAIQNNNCTAPCEVSFQNQSQNAQAHRWEFGDGGTSTEVSPKRTYTKGGTYTTKLTATGARNLTNTKEQTVTIQQPVPVANFTIENDNCIAPCTVVLRNQSQNGTSYSWKIMSSFANDGRVQYRTTTEASPAQAYANAGFWLAGSAGFGMRLAYGAELTVTGPGGTRKIEKIIRIRPLAPVAFFTYTESLNKLTFTDKSSSTGLTYLWNFSNGQTSTLQNPVIQFAPGGWTVTLDVTNETGTSRYQRRIDLYTIVR